LATPPILLANPDYYGTLAAVRCLGRAGIPVVLAGQNWLAPARWSRYATRHVTCPDASEPERFIAWLLDFAKDNERHVLYPTSDDIAWIYAAHREVLAPHFYLHQPPYEALQRVLNKRDLARLCREAGLSAPATYIPSGGSDEASDADLMALVRNNAFPLEFPVLIKPSTQVLIRSNTKGELVREPADLPAAYRSFRDRVLYHPMLVARSTDASNPMIQQYYERAVDGVYTVSGFVDDSGGIVALGARKILQRPRKFGIGLCFEEALLPDAIKAGLLKLCQAAEYFGVFDAEFIEHDGDLMLIDFNPRFYSQMAFECDRELHLPLLAYRAALGDGIQRDRADARPALPELSANTLQDRVYTHKLVLDLMLLFQGLSGALSPAEVKKWRAWYKSHRGRITDAVSQRGDAGPAIAEGLRKLAGYAKHPGVTIRSMVLNR
jgi:D-aspartate ligase